MQAQPTSDGKNLNPVVMEEPSKKLKDLEKERLQTEMAFLKTAGSDDCPEDGDSDEIDAYEVFDMLRHINDPEHPLTLE